MEITRKNPAMRYLQCYDRNGSITHVNVLDTETGIGVWEGSIAPVAFFEFVVPDEDVKTQLRDYLGPTYAPRVRLEEEDRAMRVPWEPATPDHPTALLV